MTTVYLMRHSAPFYDLQGDMKSKDSLQIINEKNPLGVLGEKFAEKVASLDEFKNIDEVWSSNYVRAMSTAKYFADKNGVKVNVDDRFGERIQGIITWDDRPKDFYERQFYEDDYRWRIGECQREVTARMREALFNVVSNGAGKRIAIVSHATASMFLLKSLCDVKLISANPRLNLSYNFLGKEIYLGQMGFCETFKLEFDEKMNLQSISHIDTYNDTFFENNKK